MGRAYEEEYWVPEHVREYLRALGFVLPLEAMEPHIRSWHEWMQACGSFYDYKDTDGVGRLYEVHRRSIHPAMRVCWEWGSLLLNDKTQVVCGTQECTDWLEGFLAQSGFMAAAQATVVKAFGMGTGAWALWVDADAGSVRIRHYDARMVIPLTWDEEGVTECAFVTRAFWRGRAVDQLQMHLKGAGTDFSAALSFSPNESVRRSSGAAASGVACGIGWAARSPQALSVELASSGVARGAVAALGRLLAGAAGRRLLVERLGGGCRWRVVAAELPPQ